MKCRFCDLVLSSVLLATLSVMPYDAHHFELEMEKDCNARMVNLLGFTLDPKRDSREVLLRGALLSKLGIELNLKHVRAGGVHGRSSLSGVIFGEWLEDISQNQVHKFFRGVAPQSFLCFLLSTIRRMIGDCSEACEKVQLRSFEVSLDALGLGSHLAAGAHEILKQIELALGDVNPTSFTSEKGDRRSKVVQPWHTREGIEQACESLSQGLERTPSSLVGNPLKVYQRCANTGFAVASTLRAAPTATVAPASTDVGAFHRALLGV